MEELDKLLMVQLRDGRKIMGILRCLLCAGSYHSAVCLRQYSRHATVCADCNAICCSALYHCCVLSSLDALDDMAAAQIACS